MCPEHETFWTLLRDPAHWEFEIFLIVVIDILILGLLWPRIRKHLNHHNCPPEEKRGPGYVQRGYHVLVGKFRPIKKDK